MVGVRQFKGSSSAMTVSVKGTPCCSSSGVPSIWYSRPADLFLKAEQPGSGGTSCGSGKGITLAGGTGTGPLLRLPRLERLSRVVGLIVEELLQARALVGQPPLRVGKLLVKLVTAPPCRCPKTCSDRAGQPQGP
ncbi:UNVERIFIED_CONTAM: hypothetical protein Sradi_0698400 [Sesamum radiatum]|uniref:Uncharacterized protein n=1 Tax=Sesamum radiatum TaxID=300843 RepID=A0AAW2VP13_SESRA